MPKVVDHDHRRTQIAEAVLSIVAGGGVSAATLRRVATGSGYPMSTIQHYFRSTQQMLQYALALIEARKAERINARVRSEWAHGPRAVLEGIFDEVLPLTPERVRETAVGAAYYVAWQHDEELKTLLLQDIPAARAGFVAVVREGQRHGQIDPGREAEREAELLFTLADALATGIIVGYQQPEEAQRTADYYLDRLFMP